MKKIDHENEYDENHLKTRINNDDLFKGGTVDDDPVETSLPATIDFSKADSDCVSLINWLNKGKDEFNREEFKDRLKAYKEKHERLLYSVLTRTVYDQIFKDDTSTDRILHNLTIMCAVSFDDDDEKKIFIKLNDHINLAAQQFNFISLKSGNLLNDFNVRISSAASEQEERFDSKINESIKSTEKNFDSKINESVKSTEKNYITILGIFASIVIAFVAGVSLNSSILENMHESTLFEITFVATLVFLGTIHLVYLLTSWIERINDKEIKYPCWMKILSVISGLLLLISICCSNHFG